MNSINQNQEEKNHQDLTHADAVEKIKALLDSNRTCFLTTEPASAFSNGTRPMSVQQVEENGDLWFLVANDSGTYADISANEAVKLYFQGSPHSDFLYLEAKASLSSDKAKIKELWEPAFKTWFTEGEDDPRIALIKVVPADGYYWDNKHGNMVAGFKIMLGAVLGTTLDDSIEGKLTV